MPVYRCTGVDRDSGEPRSGLINARSSEAAIKAANEIGLIVEDVTELPGPSKSRRGAYEVVFAVLKTLAMFLAFSVLVGGFGIAHSAIQQTTVITLGCFFLIVARIFQAEEHSRGIVRRMK